MKSLRAWRTERLLSTRRLAVLAGASNKTIVQLENGRQTASFATIEKISRVLEVDPREVTEFVRALNQRAGTTVVALPPDGNIGTPRSHIVCICGSALSSVLTRRLVERGRYGVTTSIDAGLSVEQIACLSPDLVILDIDAGTDIVDGLLRHLPWNAAAARIPVILTGRDRRRLDALMAGMADGAGSSILALLATGDLGELLVRIDELTLADALQPQV